MKFVKIFCGYCSVWKVCFLIFFFFFFWYGLETEMMVLTVEMEKKNGNTHTQTSYPICFLCSWGCVCFGLRFVLEIDWIENFDGYFLWVLFELKSLFLDFGRMEKMVGLSSDRWWYEDVVDGEGWDSFVFRCGWDFVLKMKNK